MTQTMFDESATNTETPAKQESVSPVEALVGENKKFKDVESLAKSKLESDQFIEQLKAENAELRKELTKRPTSEDVLNIIKEQTKPSDTSRENTTPVLDEDTLGKLVDSRLSTYESNKKVRENILKADKAMKDTYGEKAREVLVSTANKLGMTLEDLKNTASKSPEAFLKLVGLNEPKKYDGVKFDSGKKNTTIDILNSSVKDQSIKAWADNLRKTDQKKYFTPEVQNIIFKAKKDGTFE